MSTGLDASSSSSTGDALLPPMLSSSSGVGSSSSSSSSSGGVFLNLTLPLASTPNSILPSLPVSNLIAVVLVCALVVLICVCLFACARNQIVGPRTNPAKAPTQMSRNLQAKVEAARRGWKRGSGDGADPAFSPGQSLAMLALHGANGATLVARSSELQAFQAASVRNSSLGGLGACRIQHFHSPTDFRDEPWATEGVVESLKASGMRLDCVLAAQQCMFMAGLSGVVPLIALCALPFHELLLKYIELSDWYGPRIKKVQFLRCMIICGGACLVHLLSYLAARSIFNYDRSASIAREKEQARLKGPAAPTAFDHVTSRGGLAAAIKMDFAGSFEGKDPSLVLLTSVCVATLLAYGLLGFQGYISCDESGGRQYGVTSTPKRFWPPTAGEAPAITFILCVMVGATAMVPLGFSVKLLALFHPRKVHPHLISKFD